MQLLEYCEADSCTTGAAGVIKNVVVLGSKSKNGREYSLSAMRRAVPLYEGVAVYDDHPDAEDMRRKSRRPRDRFGELKNVRFVESEGKIRGDLVYLTSHPLAVCVAEDLRRGTRFFGLSHWADGTGRTRPDGTTFVESISKVREVDLVTKSATTLGLMESEQYLESSCLIPTDPAAVARMLRRDEPVRVPAGRTSQRTRARTPEVVPSDPRKVAIWLRR